MAAFERHVFVCTNKRAAGHPRGCCDEKDSASIRAALKEACRRAGLKGRVRVNQAGCLDQCEHGVTMVVYPDGIWYGFVTLTDVDEIVDAHLLRGEPVKRLRLANDCINTPACAHRPT